MKRILIVDDDPDVLETLAAILEDGYDVAIARNGVDALKRIVAEHFDAILLDLAMPQKDGASVVREMNARRIDVPVILVSASHDLSAKARALGVADYLMKPFTAPRLEEKVAALLGTRAPAPPQMAETRAAASLASGVGGLGGGRETDAGHTLESGHEGPTSDRAGHRPSRLAPAALPRDFIDGARAVMDARNSVLAELQHIPPDAFLLECARRLGVLQGDDVVLRDMSDQLVFLDFCTYAFESRGRGAVELFRAQRRPRPGTHEQIVLDAMMNARFSLYEVRKKLGGDGAILLDLVTGTRATVVDDCIALPPGTRIACRTFPLEDFALLTAPCRVLSGAAAASVRADLDHMTQSSPKQLASNARPQQTELALWVLRTCFAASHGLVMTPATRSYTRH